RRLQIGWWLEIEFPEHGRSPYRHGVVTDSCLDAAPALRFEVASRRNVAPGAGGLDDRPGEGVLGVRFGGGGENQQAILGAVHRRHSGDRVRSLGESSRLVEEDHVDL